jgi:protein-S-isoprenylcysteine O-methyltransferase Ste14
MSGNKHFPRLLRGVERNTIRTWLVLVGLVLVNIEVLPFAIGCALVVVATALRLWAKGYLKQDEVLTIGGPYRWSRNPFYFFNLILDIGVFVVINSWWLTVVYFVVWVVVYHRVITREEVKLTEIFGQPYRDYLKRVPRVIPTLWRHLPKSPDPQRFSWSNPNLSKRNEYGRALRALCYPLAFYVAWDCERDWPDVFSKLHWPEIAAFTAVVLLWTASFELKRRVSNGRVLLPPWVHAPASTPQ